jgi:transposase
MPSKQQWVNITVEAERMVGSVDRGKIIGMKHAGLSNHEISRQTGHDRKTISKIWSEYCALMSQMKEPGADIREIQERVNEKPKYNGKKRVKRKFTEELKARLKEIVIEEKAKTRRMGAGHKQKLTNRQIHEKVRAEGFDIGISTVCTALAELRKRHREVYIRQEYDFGDRLEYDFGEVRLDCGEGMKTYHMAILSSPGGKFRWAYLYTNQKKGVFMDSHVRFFEMMGGCWREVVYDNMKNVVHKFIGKNEKELNPDLLRMASYYGFIPNVTNCFKGNEKGHVENSVKVLRNQIFSDTYVFGSLEDAREYLRSQLLKLNESSQIEDEKKRLLPYKPMLELAIISSYTVNSCSMICVDTAFYSVPERLVGEEVIVKKYHDEIRVYAKNELVCSHTRIFGNGNMRVDIYHYLNTLLRKPGAVRNSRALKSIPRLKAIFDTHYSKQPKKFIEIFLEHKDLPIAEIVALFEEKTRNRAEIEALDVVRPISNVDAAVRAIMINYGELIYKGAGK